MVNLGPSQPAFASEWVAGSHPVAALSRMFWFVVLTAGCGATVQGATPGDGPGVIAVEQGDERDPLGIPPEELPAPGTCRLWLPGRPVSAQAPPAPCGKIEPSALGGSWVLERPTDKPDEVYVRVIDPRRVGVVVTVRRYRAATGEYLGRMEP